MVIIGCNGKMVWYRENVSSITGVHYNIEESVEPEMCKRKCDLEIKCLEAITSKGKYAKSVDKSTKLMS